MATDPPSKALELGIVGDLLYSSTFVNSLAFFIHFCWACFFILLVLLLTTGVKFSFLPSRRSLVKFVAS